MAIKIESTAQTQVPGKTQAWLEAALNTVPREHMRGIERVRLVDAIIEPRLKTVAVASSLPGLYHPRQGTQPPWLEIAVAVLLDRSQPFFKRMMARLSFKGNLAAVTFSLIGQHYYLTLRHSVRKTQLEPLVKAYTEKALKTWHEKQNTFRARLFKPLQPTFEKWGKALQKKAAAEKKMQNAK